MFDVLLVDDEPIICKGFANIIDWNKLNCRICGIAYDGMEGKEKIAELKPHIIISDISMPGLNGLDMVKETRQIIPYSKVIILTGYRNFEYAQEALKLGAFDYILKPSKVEEITSIVKRAVMQLNFEMRKEDEMENLKKHFEKAMPILKEKLLYDIISYRNVDDHVLNELTLYNVSIINFIMSVIEVDVNMQENKPDNDKYLYRFGVINTFSDMLSEKYIVERVNISSSRIAFIIQLPEISSKIQQDLYKNICDLQQFVSKCFDFTITAAVSSIGHGTHDLPDKMKECVYALQHKFYMGNGSIILYKDLAPMLKNKDLSFMEDLQKLLIESIYAGNEEEVKSLMSRIYENISKVGAADRDSIKFFYWGIFEAIYNIRKSFKPSERGEREKNSIINIYNLVHEADDLNTLHETLEQSVIDIVNKIKVYNQSHIDITMERAAQYIRDNYNSSISLNDVAEHTYVSTYYLSRMFKKYFDKNFVDFLNEIRMEKAKQYLKDPKYKTYEVGELVGIPDAHYFSKLFKKFTGITATEFRACGRTNN